MISKTSSLEATAGPPLYTGLTSIFCDYGYYSHDAWLHAQVPRTTSTALLCDILIREFAAGEAVVLTAGTTPPDDSRIPPRAAALPK